MAFGDIVQFDEDHHSLSDPIVCNLATPPTAGNLLFFYEAVRSDKGRTWSQLPSGFVSLYGADTIDSAGGNSGTLAVAYKWADGSEGTSFSFSILGSDRCRGALAEIEMLGYAGQSLVDSTIAENTSSVVTHTPASIATTEQWNLLVVAAQQANGSATLITNPSGWSIIDNGRTDTGFGPLSILAVKPVQTPGSNSVSISGPSSGSWGSWFGAFWSGIESDDVRGVIATGWAS